MKKNEKDFNNIIFIGTKADCLENESKINDNLKAQVDLINQHTKYKIKHSVIFSTKMNVDKDINKLNQILTSNFENGVKLISYVTLSAIKKILIEKYKVNCFNSNSNVNVKKNNKIKKYSNKRLKNWQHG